MALSHRYTSDRLIEGRSEVFRIFVFLLLSANSASANDAPFLLNDHSFDSHELARTNRSNLFYQVCNQSGDASAFRWYAAGFAVNAPFELATSRCAWKYVETDATAEERLGRVAFQGRPGGRVMAHEIDRGTMSFIWSRLLTIYVGSPDGRGTAVDLEILLQRLDSELQLVTSTTSDIDRIAFAFPEAEADGFDFSPDTDGIAWDFVQLSELGIDVDSESPITQGLANDDFAFVATAEGAENIEGSARIFNFGVLGSQTRVLGISNGAVVFATDLPLPATLQ